MQACEQTGVFNDENGDCPECGGDSCLRPIPPGTDTECVLCGPGRYFACVICRQWGWHRHLQEVNRQGEAVMESIMCSACIAKLAPPGPPIKRRILNSSIPTVVATLNNSSNGR